jgi:hypothetical protein
MSKNARAQALDWRTVPVWELDELRLIEERLAILERAKSSHELERADLVRLTWLRWQINRVETARAYRRAAA